MPIELSARTRRGAALTVLAERLASDLAQHAPAHDRDGTYPFDGITALREAGYFAAAVPEPLGGLGVRSLHDLAVAASRLARGDASLAIGVNMPTAVGCKLAPRWEAAVAAGDERRAAAFGATLEEVAREGTVIATAVSEIGQDLTRPATTATRT